MGECRWRTFAQALTFVTLERFFGIATPVGADQVVCIALRGSWVLAQIGPLHKALRAELSAAPEHAAKVRWDCHAIDALDSAGAMLLWQVWGQQLPENTLLRPEQLRIFERIRHAGLEPMPVASAPSLADSIHLLGDVAISIWRHLLHFVALIGQLCLDMLHLLRHPRDFPGREVSATIYKSGASALPVTAMLGCLIGIVLSFLSALQLKQLGADVFIINILGMGIVRELGPMLVAVLVAGRSGSAMTAQLGVMRVTEEVDALAAMGISRSLRLVLPKVLALAITMPLLVLWTTAMALAGGMVAADLQLDIDYGYFVQNLPRAVPVVNLWIGLGKGVVFGVCIALVACHFGLRVKPNTESLSANTTAAVVTAITMVIIVDAIFAVLTRSIGLMR